MGALADRPLEKYTAHSRILNPKEIEEYLSALKPQWKISNQGHLEKLFVFGNFIDAMQFANRVADLAEVHEHHPDMHIGWGRCAVELWTHDLNGLHQNDFILAAKIDALDS